MYIIDSEHVFNKNVFFLFEFINMLLLLTLKMIDILSNIIKSFLVIFTQNNNFRLL
jgi:hypothetical protein